MVTDVVHTWVDQVPVLSPTPAQHQGFSSFMHTAEALDHHRTGVIKVNLPEEWYEEIHNPLPSFRSKKCLQYQVQRGENGIF